MTIPRPNRWQDLETLFLSDGIDNGSSRIYLNWYVEAITKKNAATIDEIADSLRRVTGHIYASGGAQLINPCTTLFDVYCRYKLWDGYLSEPGDEHTLAALALISVQTMYDDDIEFFSGVKDCIKGWLGTTYEYNYETRVSDLSDVLFGKVWTSIYEAEFNNVRAILDAVMDVRPSLIHKTPSTYPESLEAAPDVPSDIAI